MLKNFEFTVEEKDKVVVVKIKGELDALVAPKLKDKLIELSEAGKNKIIINFEELSHINSLAMGILRGRLREAKENGGDIKLIKLNPHIETIFEMVGLDEVFEIYAKEDEAIAKF